MKIEFMENFDLRNLAFLSFDWKEVERHGCYQNVTHGTMRMKLGQYLPQKL